MKRRFQQSAAHALGAVLLMCLAVAVVPAQRQGAKRLNDAARHSREAAKVFEQIMGVPDNQIPKELLDRAEAIAVFPGVVKAAFIVGGRGGQGLISRRTAGGWSAPAFLNMAGG